MNMRALLLLLAMAWAWPAQGESVSDPTAPPVGFRPDVAAMYPVGQQTAGGGLQGIIGSTERTVAIINGQMVAVGGYYGEARLIEAGHGQAVLLFPDGRRQLLQLRRHEQRVDRAATPQAPGETATVIASSLRLRAAPQRQAGVVGGLFRGDRIDVLGSNGDWLHVRKGSLSGYVHRDFVRENDTEGAGAEARPSSAAIGKVE